MFEDVPVLICGGGLVGLSTAMFLGQHGIAATVVERLQESSPLPRAAFFHMRTLELFREAGIEADVRVQSEREFAPDGAVVAVESLAGKLIASFIPTLNEGVEEVSPCRRLFVSQPGLEPILRRRAEHFDARVLTGHELIEAGQDGHGVTATVRDAETGGTRNMRAKYLVGADGGRSPLREQLGIPMDGHGSFSNSITIYFRADLSRHVVGRDFSVIYVINPALSGFFRFSKDGKRGFLAVNVVGDPRANPEAAANAAADTSEPRLIELVRGATGVPDLEVELEGVARWRCSADIARAYGDGRIFLAGDAVHLMPPTGGFGGNTGVHDAHNLAWKLALVLKGAAGEGLLDTYNMERQPVGHFTVEQAYTRYVTRTAPYLGATDYQPVAHDFAIELGYLYRSPAVLSEPDAPQGHEDPRVSFGRPGSRAPHLWLEKNGTRISTIDLFGRGFVLLAGPEGDPWVSAARESASSIPALPLEAHLIGAGHLRDPANDFPRAFGIGPAGASLVRPDGFVAWRSPSSPPENAPPYLLSVFEKILAR